MALLNNADAIYFGDRPVDRIYLGPQRVWPWTPELLFQNGEQGAIYSLTPDFAGLYQDAVGTTPVTAVGQPVGLMLDRRFGLARGEELVPPGSVQTGAGWAFTPEAVTFGPSGTTFVRQAFGNYLAFPVPTGALVEVILTLSAVSAGQVRVGFTHNLPASATDVYAGNAAGTHRVVVRTGSTTGQHIRFDTNANGDSFTLSSISIRELPGNRASQPTTTARPTLRSGPLRIDYDGADDFLRTTFPSALGSNVTIARSIPGEGAQILTGQTVGTEWDDNVTSCATLVIDRALTDSETALATAFLNQQAGV